VDTATVGATVEETAIEVEGYTVDGDTSKEITLSATKSENEIIFYYKAVSTSSACAHENTTEANKKAPTCTEAGYTGDTVCDDCHETVATGSEVDATGHTVVTDAAVAATCTEAGKTEGSHCSVCNEVLVKQETVEALGHTWNDGEVTKAATCESAGVKTYTCTACGETKTEVIPTTDHTWNGGEITAAATCESAGVKTYTCTVCGETKTEEIPAIGHTEVTDAAVAATCTVAGKTEGSHCSACGKVLVAQETVEALGHTVVTDAAVAATCTETGLTEGSHCSVCGAVLTAQETVAVLGHTPGDTKIENSVEPTYTEDGSYEKVVSCTVCDTEISRTTITVPATGHTWNDGEITKAATCEEDGVKTYTCDDCGETRTETIAALGHEYDDWIEDEEAGKHYRVCVNDENDIETADHNWGQWTGVTRQTRTCEDCKATQTRTVGTVVNTVVTPGNSGNTTISSGSGITITSIIEEEVPLAGAVGLNSDDHVAYIVGYADGSVRPNANITRAEVATIFFRLMTDEYRAANWSTENSFSDVTTDAWYNNAVSTAAAADILTGYADGTFRPNQSITRAEFAAIAARFLSSEVEDNGTSRFSDIAGHWAEDAINRAVAAGWISGYSDGTFRPDQLITRAEVVSVINSMLDRIPTEDGLLDEMSTFTDNLAGNWYYADVQEAANTHDYDRDVLGISEIWTAILPARDWTALENEWATAYAGQTTETADAADDAEETPAEATEADAAEESAAEATENAEA
jgi:hypothetical protein